MQRFAISPIGFSPFARRAARLLAWTALSAGVACSSSDDAAPNAPASNCACDVTNQGVSQHIACGGSACVSGTSFDCGDGAEITKGGACKVEPPSDDAGKVDSAASGELTCESYAWCGSGNVSQWNGQKLPTDRGGTIADGVYREAYRLAELGSGTSFGDYGSAYVFKSGRFRDLGSLGSVGTFTTSGAILSLQKTANCNNDTGATGKASTIKLDTEYLVDPSGQVITFSKSVGSSGTQTIATVFRKVNALCKDLPSTVPASPGDSYVCKVTNCGCTEASPGPASASTCKFVHGG